MEKAPLLEQPAAAKAPTPSLLRPSREILNVVVLGLAFLLMMAAFQTSSFFQGGILKDQGYGDLGLTTLGLLQACFAVSNFVAPFAIGQLGPRWCMMLGGCFYVLMLSSLIHVNKAFFIVASAFNGVGAALLWTSEGNAITRCSSPSTRGRNSGIFWALLNMSLFVGSTVAILVVPANDSAVSHQTATTLYICLASLCAGGVLLLLALRLDPPSKDEPPPPPLLQSLRETMHMLTIPSLLLLCILIFYSGLLMSFWQGQYPLLVGNKDDRVELPHEFKPRSVAYLMIVIGVSEVLGSLGFGKLSDHLGRWPVVLIGMVLASLVFLLIYLGLVHQSFKPHLALAYGCGFGLGLVDSILNTQVFSILGDLFPDHSAGAFAVNFVARSLASTCAFYSASHLSIGGQLLFMFLTCVAGTAAFVHVDRKLRVHSQKAVQGAIINGSQHNHSSA